MDRFELTYSDLNDQSEKLGNLRWAFLRSNLLVSSTLLGILVSLRGSNVLHTGAALDGIAIEGIPYAQIAWASTMLVLPLCILFGAAALYGEVYLAQVSYLVMRKALFEQKKADKISPVPAAAHRRRIFDVFEALAYIFFVLGMVSLGTYALLISF